MEPDSQVKPAPAESKPEQLPAQVSSSTSNLPDVQPPSVAKPATATTGPSGNAGATPAAAVKYKIVSITQPDGSIKKFKRPILQGNDSGNAATKPSKTTAAPNDSGATKGPATKYKIVVIPQPDGSMKKFKRPIVESSGSAVTQPLKATPAASATEATKAPTENPGTTTSNETKDSKVAAKPTPATVTRDAKADIPQEEQEKPVEMDPASLQRALDEQKNNSRERKMHGFRSKLTRGLAMAIGSSIPAFEISSDHQAGDIEMSDDDYSDDDDMEDDGMNDVDDNEIHDHDGQDGHSSAVEQHHDHDCHNTVALDGKAATSNLLGAMATRAAQPPPRQPAPAASEKAAGGVADKREREVPYKISAKEVSQLDQKAENMQPLKRHWANVTFYILASLSIVLPLLFLFLAIAVFLMNGKETTSNWGLMVQAIKVGVSAWPIIFAAVVAQVFKTVATYKVERGIKLMELEQLVGSNSFASAVKQPILLRRLDILSLVLFVTWCVSPLGSSALQRTYTTEHLTVNTTTTAYYLNTTGANRLFNRVYTASGSYGGLTDVFNEAHQGISVLYMADFALPGVSTSDAEDNYNHPRAPWLDDNVSISAPSTTSGYGVPLVMSDSIFGQADSSTFDSTTDTRVEATNFVMRSSYFNFTCGSWSVVNRSYFDIADAVVSYNQTVDSSVPCSEAAQNITGYYPDNSNYTDGTWHCTESVSASAHTAWLWSTSNTTHSRFGFQDPTNPQMTTVNSIDFASTIKGLNSTTDQNGLTIGDEDSLHSLITCSFEQIFIEYGVACSQSGTSLYGTDCSYDGDFLPVHQVSDPVGDPGAFLGREVPSAFAQYTNPNLGYKQATTPNEIFLGLYGEEQKFNTLAFNLSALVTPGVFGHRMAYLFNTLVDLGNYYDLDTTQSFMTNLTVSRVTADTTNFIPVPNAHWYHTGAEIFVLNVTWAVIFLICDVILLAAGIVSVAIESLTVAPDTLGYVSTVARNSKHLQLPKTEVNSAMSGGERAKKLGSTVVMMQDVSKPGANVGRIALGMKHEKAKKLESGRLYR